MTLPDRFVAHGSPKWQYQDAGLDAPSIVGTALMALGYESAAEQARA
jgi:1-deoxy-D-xylulose-5-phosphate synthase